MPPEKRQITRNRASYSCQTCRRRKVKCDKKHPICGTCEKNNEECVYATEYNDHSLGTDQPSELTRKRKLALDVGAEHDEVTDSAENATTRDKLTSIQALLEKASALADEVGLTRDTTAIPRAVDEDDTAESLQGISQKLQSLSLLFQSGDKESRQPSVPVDAANVRSHITLPPQERWEKEMSNKSVTDAQSNVIFRCWLYSTYSMLPIVDPFDALEIYNAFQYWYIHDFDKGISNPVVDYMPLVDAIRYGGILGMSARGVRRWFPEVPRRMILSGLRLSFWRTIDKVTPSVMTVAAEVMMRHMCHERYNMSQSSAQLVVLIRRAQALGLHRTDESLMATASGQITRRLWWEIVNLDTLLSSSCLVPPLLDSHFFDDKLPVDIKDSTIGTQDAFAYEMSLQAKAIAPAAADFPFDDTRPSPVSIHNLVSRARATWSTSLRKLIAVLTGSEAITTSSISQMSQMLHAITVELRGIIDRIPTNDTPESMEPPSPSTRAQSVSMDHGTVYGGPLTRNEIEYHLGRRVEFEESQMPFAHQIELSANAFHKWARITLSLMLDQICCFTFGQFLKNPQSTLWNLTRDCAMEGCHNYFRKYLMVASNLELERFRWTWIGMFQPAHASKILLVDLHERPFSEQAMKSRSMFDQMLLLTHHEYGIIGGDQGLTFLGPLEDEIRQSWPLLSQLRAKAWQRAGLDPSYLWNEEDQNQSFLSKTTSRRQDASHVAGRVRIDQPLFLQDLLNESDWRINPAVSSKAPFEGLSELIQKIRRSKPAGSASTQQNNHVHRDFPESNFYGDHLQDQHDKSWSEGLTRTHERFQSRAMDTVHGESDAQTNGGAHAVNALGSDERAQAYTLAVEPGRSDRNVVDMSSSGQHMWLPSDTTQTQRSGAQPNAGLEFDWSRWDLAYGYPCNSNVQRLASADADLLVEAWTHS